MVNNELAAKKALSPAAILALEKEYANKKLAAYIFPGRNLSLTVDADPQAEISSKETLAENLTVTANFQWCQGYSGKIRG